jgi:hypothetical protein
MLGCASIADNPRNTVVFKCGFLHLGLSPINRKEVEKGNVRRAIKPSESDSKIKLFVIMFLRCV